MQGLLTTTFESNSIDLVCALFFSGALLNSLRYLWLNHLTVEGRIKYLFIIVVSSLQIYQTVFQFLSGHNATYQIWDIINYLTAVFMLMVAHRMSVKETK